MRRSRLVLVLALVAGGALLALAACSPKKLGLPNLPPHTTLFVQFQNANPADHTVSHVVHLYWFGSDPDGRVVGYEIRFKNNSAPADSGWVATTRTDSLFYVYSPEAADTSRFEVRAIDNQGLRDPQPAFQDFRFSNQAPIVTMTTAPGSLDSTFASLTLAWQGSDPDGDPSRIRFLVWLDGHQADPHLTTGHSITLPTSDFRQGGKLRSGPRQVSVQAIDDGGRASDPLVTTWYVRAPVPDSTARARLLLVDDVPHFNAANFTLDTLYSNAVQRNVPAGSWSLVRLEFTQPFQSVEDVRQTFALFDAVIWYRGTETFTGSSTTRVIQAYRNGFAAYLDAGGRFYIESLDLFEGPQANGLFPEDFVSRYFGSDSLMTHADANGFQTALWSIKASYTDIINGVPVTTPVILHSSVFQDSLRQGASYDNLRGFAVRDTHDVAIWARDSSLTPRIDRDVPIAVTVPQPSGGRAIGVTLPLRTSDVFRSVPRFLAKVLQQLGVTGP